MYVLDGGNNWHRSFDYHIDCCPHYGQQKQMKDRFPAEDPVFENLKLQIDILVKRRGSWGGCAWPIFKFFCQLCHRRRGL